MNPGMGIAGAFRLVFSGNFEVYSITFASLRFAILSTIISSAVGIPVGALLGLGKYRWIRVVMVVLQSLMAIPTVVIGLFVLSLISRAGPLGGLGLLFTPAAVVIGQSILALPIVTTLVAGRLRSIDPRLPETARTLGARKRQVLATVLWESRSGIVAAVITGFGRIIGEVGVSMMLGGNIRWYTRTLTTAIALETSKGQFELGMALGIILLVTALVVNAILHLAVRNE